MMNLRRRFVGPMAVLSLREQGSLGSPDIVNTGRFVVAATEREAGPVWAQFGLQGEGGNQIIAAAAWTSSAAYRKKLS
jgi:hypothetical protein